MCGRYASSRRPEDLIEEFEVVDDRVEKPLEPDYNVAPTKEVYAVVERPPSKDSAEPPARQLRVLRWGLIPSWAKDPSIGNRMINARMETVAEKPAFKRAVRRTPLPAAGRRLLRVVPHLAADQGRQAAQAAVLHPAPGRRGAGDGRALRDLARPHPRRGRPRAVPLDLHRPHHRGGGRRRPHPRPDAAERRPRSAGRAWLDPDDPQGLAARPAGAGRSRATWRPSPSRRPSATCATTDPSWSSRCRSRRRWSERPSSWSTRPTARGGWSPRRAHKPVATLLLGHGAGNGIEARDLEALAHYLPRNGVSVVRFEQPWRRAGRKIATPPATLDAALLAAAAQAAGAHPADRRRPVRRRPLGGALRRGSWALAAAWRWPSRCILRAARRSRGSTSWTRQACRCWSCRGRGTRWAGRRSSRAGST